MVAWKFEQERRQHPDRFNNQIKNQVMYVKHGFTEFFKPSEPITDFVDVIIDNDSVKLPQACRSLKIININSAMNGCFFWGSGKSRDFEYQQIHPPRLDDSKIEVMATRGVHDMLQHRVNLTHAQRLAQTNDVLIRFKKIPSTGIALQIDGEAWIVKQKCTLHVQIHDKLPVVIGYNSPRGVQSWLQASLDDQHIVKAKESFRQRLRRKFHQPQTPKIDNEYESESPQSSPQPPNNNKDSSDEDKDKNKLNMNQSASSSIMNMFNLNNIIKPSTSSKATIELMDADEMKGATQRTPSTPDKHIPNIPYFDPQEMKENTAKSADFMDQPRLQQTDSGRLIDKIGDLFKPKSRRNSVNNINTNIQNQPQQSLQHPNLSDLASDDQQSSEIMEVDIPQYVKNNPEIQKDKNNILQSSVFSPQNKSINKKSNDKDGIFLDRFTWWKVTRAKNYDRSIDAEAAHDAISTDDHDPIRKTKSFTVLPKAKRSASLF